MPKLLVIDGYDTEGMAFLARSGATRAGALYAQLLARFVDTDEIDIAEISHQEPVDIDPSDYDGVCWTGSNLFFSSSNEIVQRHIDLCGAFFDRGVPQFGSCWAAQLAAKTAGGEVDLNPKGREFGIARKISLNEAGLKHPMFKGKPTVFDGFTSHADIVTRLPDGATLLAGNAFAPVQALEVAHGRGTFWAVQYHPEYDCAEIAGLAEGRADALIAQGVFRDRAAAAAYVSDMRALADDDQRQDLAWAYGIDADVQDFDIKTVEVRNWLSHFFGVTV